MRGDDRLACAARRLKIGDRVDGSQSTDGEVGGLHRGLVARHPTQMVEVHQAMARAVPEVSSALSRESTVDGAVRQGEGHGREAMAADMAALPDAMALVTGLLEERRQEGSTLDGAAGISPTVRAHEQQWVSDVRHEACNGALRESTSRPFQCCAEVVEFTVQQLGMVCPGASHPDVAGCRHRTCGSVDMPHQEHANAIANQGA